MTDQNRVQPTSQREQQPQASAMPSLPRDTWKRSVPSARIMWNKLTIDELLETKGEARLLVGLLKQRYALTKNEAERRVRAFLDNCGNWF